jgi:hypothetical protein
MAMIMSSFDVLATIMDIQRVARSEHESSHHHDLAFALRKRRRAVIATATP